MVQSWLRGTVNVKQGCCREQNKENEADTIKR